MARYPLRLLFAALAAAIVLPGCDIKVDDGKVSVGVSHGRASDDWVRSYTLAKGGRFEIANQNGEIAITGTEGAEVKVTAHREVSANSDEEAQTRLKSLKMREDVSPDRVFIEAQSGGSFQRVGFIEGLRVRYEVEVPAGLTVTVKTMNGTVRLDDVDGQITAGTTNGNVTGRAVTGAVQGSAVNGSVSVNFDGVRGDSQLTTVNGAVRVELPPTADVELHAATVNGRVSLDDTLVLADRSDNRSGFGPPTNVSGRLNKGGPRLTLQTTNGPVRVAARGSGDSDDEPGPERRGRRGRGARGF
jgi:DUF4097 and DUF4098 domain-containing protein YvlB